MRKIGFLVSFFWIIASCGKVEIDQNGPVIEFVSPIENKAYSASEGIPLNVNITDNLGLKYMVMSYYRSNGNVYLSDSISLSEKEYQFNKTFQSKYISTDSLRMFLLITACDNTNNRVSSQRAVLMTK